MKFSWACPLLHMLAIAYAISVDHPQQTHQQHPHSRPLSVHWHISVLSKLTPLFSLEREKGARNAKFFSCKTVILRTKLSIVIVEYWQAARTQTQASSDQCIKCECLWGWAVGKREIGDCRRAVKTVWHLGPVSQWHHLLHQGCKLLLHWTLRRGKGKHRAMPDCTERPVMQRISFGKAASWTSWPSSICCYVWLLNSQNQKKDAPSCVVFLPKIGVFFFLLNQCCWNQPSKVVF